MTATGPDWIEYQAFPDEVGTDEFTYAVEDWVGQRAVAKIRVGIGPRPTARPSSRGTTRSPSSPASGSRSGVLANDVDSSGGELTLATALDMPAGTDAKVEGRRIVVHAPDQPGVLQIAYTVSNDRGGQDTGVLTVTVAETRRCSPRSRATSSCRRTDTMGGPRSPSTCWRSRRTRAGR